MKDIILGLFLLAILSACGVRKVQTNKSTTEIKETSVQSIKIDSTATIVVKNEVKEKQTEHFVDTSKTIIEYFNPEGKIEKRITTNNYIAFTKKKEVKAKQIDSVKLSVLKDLKDSSVVSVKKIEKVKQTEAKRYNMLLFGVVLCVGVAMYLYVQRKYRQ